MAAEGYPFFRPPWGRNVVGTVLDADVDWDEVTELLDRDRTRVRFS